ncbi:MAG: helix-turn-helix transcriptional regulator [Erysipelotrichaceae bacterium]|nr:helix-turn-helix transcriptional regulator [Erysipelotrichaceae bacterium]
MFKEKLKELREKNKISQYELSTIIHVSRAAIAKWESGKGIPNKENIKVLADYFKVSKEYLLDIDDLYQELNKRDKIKSNLKYHLPVIFLSFVLLILTAVELFVFVREGIYLLDSGHYPNLSILTIFQGWSLIPIGIYIIMILFNILFIYNTWEITNKTRLIITVTSCVLVLTCYIVSFVVSYNLVKPYNYGMFWKPHLVEERSWIK